MQVKPEQARLVIFVVMVVAAAVILFHLAGVIWPVLQLFIIAGFLALACEYLIGWQLAHGIPRWSAVSLLVFLVVLGAVIGGIFLIPQAIAEAGALLAKLPAFWQATLHRISELSARYPQLAQMLQHGGSSPSLFAEASAWLNGARTVFTTAVGSVFAVIVILVTTLYTLLNPWPLLYGVRGLFPSAWWPTLDHLAATIARRIQAWILATLLLGIIVGVLDFLALWLINIFSQATMPSILFFAMLGAMLEIVPTVGPIIATGVATLVGFLIDPVLGLMVLAAFALVQQLENHVFVPLIMGKIVSLHPVSTIFALLVLSVLFGVFGALIAVPVAASLKVIYDDWYYPLLHDGQPPMAPREEKGSRGEGEKGRRGANEK